jgi:hypothetical protein
MAWTGKSSRDEKVSVKENLSGMKQPADTLERADPVEEAGLSPFAYRLIGHLDYVADPEERTVQEGVRPIARSCMMSAGKVVSAKKELVTKGLISIIVPGNPKTSTPDTIKLLI